MYELLFSFSCFLVFPRFSITGMYYIHNQKRNFNKKLVELQVVFPPGGKNSHLANKKIECSVAFEFQINDKLSYILHGPYLD